MSWPVAVVLIVALVMGGLAVTAYFASTAQSGDDDGSEP